MPWIAVYCVELVWQTWGDVKDFVMLSNVTSRQAGDNLSRAFFLVVRQMHLADSCVGVRRGLVKAQNGAEESSGRVQHTYVGTYVRALAPRAKVHEGESKYGVA